MEPSTIQGIILGCKGGADEFQVEITNTRNGSSYLSLRNGATVLHGVLVASSIKVTYMGDNEISRMNNLGNKSLIHDEGNPFENC